MRTPLLSILGCALVLCVGCAAKQKKPELVGKPPENLDPARENPDAQQNDKLDVSSKDTVSDVLVKCFFKHFDRNKNIPFGEHAHHALLSVRKKEGELFVGIAPGESVNHKNYTSCAKRALASRPFDGLKEKNQFLVAPVTLTQYHSRTQSTESVDTMQGVSGPITQSEVDNLFAKSTKSLLDCHPRSTPPNPGDALGILVQMDILPDGQIGTLNVRSTEARKSETTRCVRQLLSTFKLTPLENTRLTTRRIRRTLVFE